MLTEKYTFDSQAHVNSDGSVSVTIYVRGLKSSLLGDASNTTVIQLPTIKRFAWANAKKDKDKNDKEIVKDRFWIPIFIGALDRQVKSIVKRALDSENDDKVQYLLNDSQLIIDLAVLAAFADTSKSDSPFSDSSDAKFDLLGNLVEPSPSIYDHAPKVSKAPKAPVPNILSSA